MVIKSFYRSMGVTVLAVLMFFIAGCGGSSNTTTSAKKGFTLKGKVTQPAKKKKSARMRLQSQNLLGAGKRRTNTPLGGRPVEKIQKITARMAKKNAAATETGLSGAICSLVDVETGKEVAGPVTTDADGFYNLPDVTEGKSFEVVCKKIDKNADGSLANATVIKVPVADVSASGDKDGDGVLDEPPANEATTLACEAYVSEVKKHENDAGFDPDKINADDLVKKYDGMTDEQVAKLYDSYDKEIEKAAASGNGDIDTSALSEVNSAADATFSLLDVADTALNGTLQTLLGTDWETKMNTLDAAIQAAGDTLEQTLADEAAKETKPDDDYDVYLASSLTKLGISTTADELHTEFDDSNATLHKVIDDASATQSAVNAAWERFYAEQQLIPFGVDITDAAVIAKLNDFQTALVTAFDSADLSDDGTAEGNLWNYVDNEQTKEAGAAIGITITDADLTAASSAIGDGCVDNDMDFVNDSANSSLDCKTVFDATKQHLIDNGYANGQPPASPDLTTADQPTIDKYYQDLNTYWDHYHMAFDPAYQTALTNATSQLTVSWAAQADKVSQQILAVNKVQDTAYDAYASAWDIYWKSHGTAIDAAWAAYDAAVAAAYTVAGVTQAQIDDAFLQAKAAYQSALDETKVTIDGKEMSISDLIAAGLLDSSVLNGLANQLQSPGSSFAEDMAKEFEVFHASDDQIRTVKDAAHAFGAGQMTEAEFSGTVEKVFTSILKDRGASESSVTSFFKAVDNAENAYFDALDKAPSSTDAASAVKTAQNTYWKAIGDAMTTNLAAAHLSADETKAIKEALVGVGAGQVESLAKQRQKAKGIV